MIKIGDKMRYGILGASNIAHQFIKALIYLKKDISAIASRDIAKAKHYQTLYSISTVYDAYDDLVKDFNVDAVYISTPNSYHFEHARLAIMHQKHVIIEKPMTLNRTEAAFLFELAKEHGVFIMEAMWMAFNPLINHIKDNYLLYIGNLKSIDVDFSFNADFKAFPRLIEPSLGGGALLDIGIYPITFIYLLKGKPNQFETKTVFHETGVDIDSLITFYYPNLTAQFTISFLKDGDRCAYLYGEKGYIKIPFFFGAEIAFIYGHDHKLVDTIHDKPYCNGYEYEIMAFEKAILDHSFEANLHTKKDTLAVLSELDKIRKHWQLKYDKERYL